MPLVKGKSEAAFKQNVRTLMNEVGESPHVQSRKQALAIAYSERRRAKADGGGVFEGPIVSTVPGRTDQHETDVASGSYVLPSESVSHLGENNTNAGLKKLHEMGPHGFARLVGKSAKKFPKSKMSRFKAAGGKTGHADGSAVPVILAGGEYVLPPHWVSLIGEGDMKRGHAIIDHWVMENRKKHIKTLRSLPKPARD